MNAIYAEVDRNGKLLPPRCPSPASIATWTDLVLEVSELVRDACEWRLSVYGQDPYDNAWQRNVPTSLMARLEGTFEELYEAAGIEPPIDF